MIDEPECEREAFRKLLCAMYTRPYTFASIQELKRMTRIADFYCALPIISATLTAALLGSQLVQINYYLSCSILALYAQDLLPIAKKLRHPLLFRECFIHVISKMNDGGELEEIRRCLEGDKELWSLVKEGHAKLSQQIAEVYRASLAAVQRGLLPLQGLPFLDEPAEDLRFFKALKEELCRRPEPYPVTPSDIRLMRGLSQAVNELMRNNLVLDQTGWRPGEGGYERAFLCAKISDQDLPWDSEEVDF